VERRIGKRSAMQTTQLHACHSLLVSNAGKRRGKKKRAESRYTDYTATRQPLIACLYSREVAWKGGEGREPLRGLNCYTQATHCLSLLQGSGVESRKGKRAATGTTQLHKSHSFLGSNAGKQRGKEEREESFFADYTATCKPIIVSLYCREAAGNGGKGRELLLGLHSYTQGTHCLALMQGSSMEGRRGKRASTRTTQLHASHSLFLSTARKGRGGGEGREPLRGLHGYTQAIHYFSLLQGSGVERRRGKRAATRTTQLLASHSPPSSHLEPHSSATSFLSSFQPLS